MNNLSQSAVNLVQLVMFTTIRTNAVGLVLNVAKSLNLLKMILVYRAIRDGHQMTEKMDVEN